MCRPRPALIAATDEHQVPWGGVACREEWPQTPGRRSRAASLVSASGKAGCAPTRSGRCCSFCRSSSSRSRSSPCPSASASTIPSSRSTISSSPRSADLATIGRCDLADGSRRARRDRGVLSLLPGVHHRPRHGAGDAARADSRRMSGCGRSCCPLHHLDAGGSLLLRWIYSSDSGLPGMVLGPFGLGDTSVLANPASAMAALVSPTPSGATAPSR